MTIAREALQTLFRSPYRLSAWQDFLHRHLGVPVLLARPEPIAVPAAETARGMTGRLLGEIPETGDHFKIGFFDVAVPGTQARRRRVGLRNVLVPWLKADYDAALVAFHSTDPGVADWRVSFICDLKGEATAPKRFTYVFGDAGLALRTPLDRFASLGASREGGAPVTMEAMREAFSVEALSDEFFKAYKEHYEKFVSFITGKTFVKSGPKWEEKTIGEPHPVLYGTFDRDDKLVRDYVKKMLGRLVFLHFLQKKGWLGARGDGWTGGDPAFLQNLFAHASADQQADFLDGVLENLFFNALNTDRSASGDLFDTGVPGIGQCRIPYLNGGLFEKDKSDTRRVFFPAPFFRDLLAFFTQYNFTIDENDADEAEVGIDPEMLGRIFENLLEDNKDKGAFYTPKEIVRYMCLRSLLAHLSDGEDQASADAIAAFLDTRDPGTLPKKTAARLAAKLRDVKICDPAIGSGAFPMGLLRELFALRSALDPDADDLKRQIIENNIYGVDIEKGAVDIARLRFWLALVVDADEPVPLPNLDFKIMQGNSLVESWNGHDLSTLAHVRSITQPSIPGLALRSQQLTLFTNEADLLRKQLHDLLHEWFSCTDHERRRQLRADIEANVDAQLKSFVSDVSFSDLSPSDCFLWHVWFQDVFEQGGFDIVIGNPPYFNVETLGAKSPYAKSVKETYPDIWQDKSDILFYFFALAMRISKNVITFITSNAYPYSDKAQKLRNKMLEDGRLRKIANFERYNIFNSASITTCISFFYKSPAPFRAVNFKAADGILQDVIAYVLNENNAYTVSLRKDDIFALVNSETAVVNAKIDGNHKRLREVVVLGSGMQTGANRVFCFKGKPRHFPDRLIKRRVVGDSIAKYALTAQDEYLLYVEEVTTFKELPRQVQEYLLFWT